MNQANITTQEIEREIKMRGFSPEFVIDDIITNKLQEANGKDEVSILIAAYKNILIKIYDK